MGGSASTLAIDLDNDLGTTEDQPLPAGSKLRGNVIVEVHRNVTLPTPLEDTTNEVPALLRLRIYGKEKVCMDRGKAKVNRDQQKGRWQRPSKSAERQILDHTLRWTQFPTVEGFAAADGTTVLSGVYVFPFEMDLPLMLPSSTYFPLEAVSTYSKKGCRVQYKMEAQLTYDSSKAATMSKYLWLSAATNARTKRQATPCMVEPIAHEVSGMLQKGNIYFGAAVDDCAVRKGDNMVLRISCRNDSPASIQRVQVTLLEKLTWGTTATNRVDPKTGICSQTATLQQQALVPLFTLKDAKLPGLGKEAKGLFQSAYNSLLGVEQTRMYQREIYRDLVGGDNIIRIPIPEESKISYVGQLVKVEHVIQIQFFTNSFAKNPLLEIPVNVLPVDAPIVADATSDRPSEPYCKSCSKPPPEPVTATTGLADDEQPLRVSPVVLKPEAHPDLRSDSSGQTYEEESSMPIPASAPTEPATPIATDALVLGGDATLVKHKRYLAPSAPPSYLDNVSPIVPPNQVSVLALQREMRSAISCHNVVSSKVDQPAWTDFFQALSADGFGNIISSVDPVVDQPRIAVLLAPLLNDGRGISSQQVAAALRSCNLQHRATMAQRLLPLCTDSNFEAIRAELNDWEQTVAYNAFGEAEKRLSKKKTFLGRGSNRVAIAS